MSGRASGSSAPGERELLRSTVSEILDEHGTRARDEAARHGWSAGLWQVLAESGLTLVSVPESAGGSGGDLADLAVVLQACGYHAAPVPVAETALAGWALASAGLPVPQGPLAVVPNGAAAGALVADGPGGQRLAGRLRAVPWARGAHRVAVFAGRSGRTSHAVLDPRTCTLEPGANLAGEPRDDLVLPARGVTCAPGGPEPAAVTLRGVLCRSLLMIGALRRVLDLTVRYAGERQQFGRVIGRFQAVQQQIAALAGTVEQAQAIADLAVDTLERESSADEAVLAAKICAGHAAAVAVAVGHQVHGAIGFTAEHELQLHTRRLMAWRDEDGSECVWSAELGARVVAAGPGGLWDLLTGPAAAPAS